MVNNPVCVCKCEQGVLGGGGSAQGSQEISLRWTIPWLPECLLLSVTCQMTTWEEAANSSLSQLQAEIRARLHGNGAASELRGETK